MDKHILPRGTHYLCSLSGLKKPRYLSLRTQLAEGWINCPLLSAFRKLERKYQNQKKGIKSKELQ